MAGVIKPAIVPAHRCRDLVYAVVLYDLKIFALVALLDTEWRVYFGISA